MIREASGAGICWGYTGLRVLMEEGRGPSSMSTSCPLCMNMRRDGESRGCREAGERDLVIKSSLDSRVYLGHDRLKKRGGMGGCGVPTLTDFTQGQRNTPGVSDLGGGRGKWAWRGTGYKVLYNRYADTWRRIRTSHQTCVCPFTPAGATEAPPGEQHRC